ncbi:MAG: transporter substrate-binding domain-containing protein [Paludibacterium sp.]|uniref:transporter substrate-binding domain-containing protein n=1 Tax=Paludibacterium sp. TaxID=1917523 RepID=UPI0025E758A5|nr:transporter substrate-binding domain-containing protein [Paludibacterium sp.]MBV8046306.1 transporter substrate-binding domain-containing protein [Paludibacterium sp.]MBV8648361.1 transporter substrate-binding domain-containing protein [Paludibacterium sp.]
MRFFALWLVALCFPAMLHAETLRFGMDLNYPPFSWQDSDGQPQGFDADMARALCQDMKVRCQIVPQDWDGLVKALYLGKFDAILSSMQITASRRQNLDFTHRYYHIASRMVTHAGSPVTRHGFTGRAIGVLRGSTQASFAEDYWGKSGARIVEYDKVPAAFADLARGRLAAVFVDNVVGSDSFLSKPQGKGFSFVGPAFDDPRYFGEGAGIAVRKGDAALQQRLNQALAHLRQNGIYQQIEKKYFSIDIYGSAP